MSKKQLSCIKTLLAASLLISVNAFAADYYTNADFDCPSVQQLTNNGVTISGLGMLRINGLLRPKPLFSNLTPAGTPLDLNASGYINAGATYNPAFSRVVCRYSTAQPFPPFGLIFDFWKGAGGDVISQNASSIRLRFIWGLKA